ncbi:hypothetical protein CRUP_022692 [Coryphaenoides rupestris]|nr:hypothetical protein CRUP_022692 [Coryphaenoides rupestris]
MFRLRKLFSESFVKINKTSMAMDESLTIVSPAGFPNLKSVRELILKRGQTKIRKPAGSPSPDNTLIEQHLGKHGIICLEDLIHEIFSVGKNFRVANCFLRPFNLSVARHAARDKGGVMKDIGGPGFRGPEVNGIVRQLN